jgi:hypothetical protein
MSGLKVKYAWQENYIALLSKGVNRIQAARKVGVTNSQVSAAKRRDEEFATRCDGAKQSAPEAYNG